MKLSMNVPVIQSFSQSVSQSAIGTMKLSIICQSVSWSATGTMKLSMDMRVSQSVSYRNNEVVYEYASQSVN